MLCTRPCIRTPCLPSARGTPDSESCESCRKLVLLPVHFPEAKLISCSPEEGNTDGHKRGRTAGAGAGAEEEDVWGGLG